MPVFFMFFPMFFMLKVLPALSPSKAYSEPCSRWYAFAMMQSCSIRLLSSSTLANFLYSRMRFTNSTRICFPYSSLSKLNICVSMFLL